MADITKIPIKQLHWCGTLQALKANLLPREIGLCTDDNKCYIKGLNDEVFSLGGDASTVFYADYDETSHADIYSAMESGLLCVMRHIGDNSTTFALLSPFGPDFRAQVTGSNRDDLGIVNAVLMEYLCTPDGWRLDAKDLSSAAELGRVAALISQDATPDNPAIDKAYVDNQVNQVAARYLSGDEHGNPFSTYAQFEAAQESGSFFYSGESVAPTKNDYALVSADENHDNAVTRYWYTGSTWSFQYVVNNTPFSEAEWAAIQSGVTSERLSQIETALSGALQSVAHDGTLTGNGTSVNPLHVEYHVVTKDTPADELETYIRNYSKTPVVYRDDGEAGFGITHQYVLDAVVFQNDTLTVGYFTNASIASWATGKSITLSNPYVVITRNSGEPSAIWYTASVVTPHSSLLGGDPKGRPMYKMHNGTIELGGLIPYHLLAQASAGKVLSIQWNKDHAYLDAVDPGSGGGLSEVAHDSSLAGAGTTADPLGINKEEPLAIEPPTGSTYAFFGKGRGGSTSEHSAPFVSTITNVTTNTGGYDTNGSFFGGSYDNETSQTFAVRRKIPNLSNRSFAARFQVYSDGAATFQQIENVGGSDVERFRMQFGISASGNNWGTMFYNNETRHFAFEPIASCTSWELQTGWQATFLSNKGDIFRLKNVSGDIHVLYENNGDGTRNLESCGGSSSHSYTVKRSTQGETNTVEWSILSGVDSEAFDCFTYYEGTGIDYRRYHMRFDRLENGKIQVHVFRPH